jgi:exodeoxyribonuclease V alpha subunit
VGIVFADKEKGGVKVCFENRLPLPLHDLPPAENAFAMTVHKAQGSGFKELCFPMPDEETPLLTRELFYTALTRAARKITIYGTPEMVLKALKNRSSRNSALAERIIDFLCGDL